MEQINSSRLKGSSVYLSGPIDKCPNLGMQWRLWITPLLQQYGITVYDPLNKPITDASEIEGRELRHQWKASGEYDKLAKWMRNIRHIDLRLCDRSDFGIVWLDTKILMSGTWEELYTLNRSKKPVLVVCPYGLNEVPDWLWGCLPYQHIFSQWDDLFTYLNKIDQGFDDGTDRWLIFQY